MNIEYEYTLIEQSDVWTDQRTLIKQSFDHLYM